MPRPKVYLASKLYHAPMWRDWKENLDAIQIVSTWHDDVNIEKNTPQQCAAGWRKNEDQILRAEYLLVYAHANDKLNGALVEIGMAFGAYTRIVLSGAFPWGTWRHAKGVVICDTPHDALLHITKGHAP